MNWPVPQDINEAVQNPATAFADADLAAGAIDVGPLGVPLPRSGGFADVYRVRGADGRDWAVKCFTRPVPGLQDRYAAIDHYLRQAALPFAVDFRYLEGGLRVRGGGFPVVKMPWVEGFPLNEFVSDNLGRVNVLESMLTVWVRLCRRLRESGLAHGDIQHGNVILVPGTQKALLGVRLVDYDGMFVPALAGRPPGEFGHPSYQHPDRAARNVYSADLDRFPHLVVATALRALIAGGRGLWDTHDTGDNLLFTEADFRAPGQSKVMRNLWATADPGVVPILAHLVLACGRPLEQAPWLDLLMPEGRPATITPTQEREAAAVLGVGVTRSVATAAPASPTGSAAVLPRLPAAPVRVASAVVPAAPARVATPSMSTVVPSAFATPVGSGSAVPPAAFDFGPPPRKKRGLTLALVGAGLTVVLLGAAGAAVVVLDPFKFGPVAAVPTDPAPPPAPTTDPAPPVKPPDVPVVEPTLPKPEQTAKRLWSVKPDELPPTADLRTARFTPDGKAVVVGASGNPGRGLVLSAETGRTVTVFKEHDHPAVVAPGPAGTAYSLGKGEPKILVWSAADAKPAAPLALPDGVAGDYSRLVASADGKRVFLEGGSPTTGRVRVADLAANRDVTPLPTFTPGQLAFDVESGRMLTFVPREKQLVAWNPDGTEPTKVPLAVAAELLEAWSPDGRLGVLLGPAIGTPPRQSIAVVDAGTGQLVKAIDGNFARGTARFSADGTHLVTLAKSGDVLVWRVANWGLVAFVASPSLTPPTGVDLSADATKVAVTGPSANVRVYEIGPATEVVTTPVGKPIAGGFAELWRADGQPKAETLKRIAVAADGKTVYALAVPTADSADPTPVVRGYDAALGEARFNARVGKPGVVPTGLVPAAGGHVFLSYPAPATGPTPVAVLNGRTGEFARPTTSIDRKLLAEPRAVSADAKYLAAAYDADPPAVGVWDLDSGSQVATIPGKPKLPAIHLGFAAGDAVPVLVVAYPDRLVRYAGAAFEQPTVVTDKLAIKAGTGLGLTADGSRFVIAKVSPLGTSVAFETIDLKTAARRTLARDARATDFQLLTGDRLFVADGTTVTVTEVETAKPVSQTPLPAKADRVAASPDGTVVVAAAGGAVVAYRGYLDAAPPKPPETGGRYDILWTKSAAEYGTGGFRGVVAAAGGRVTVPVGPRLLTFAPSGSVSAVSSPAPVEYLTATADGATFVVDRAAEADAPIYRPLDPKTGKPAAAGFELPKLPADGLAYDLSPDGRYALAFAGRGVTVWSTATGQRVWSKEPDADGGEYLSAGFLDNAKVLIAARSGRDELLVVDLATARVDRAVPLGERGAGLIAHADPAAGVVLVRYPADDKIGARGFDVKTGKPVFALAKVNGRVPPRFAAGGALILAADDDTLVVFNAKTGTRLTTDTLPGPVDGFAAAPDKSHVAVLFGTADARRTGVALLKLSDAGGETALEPKITPRIPVPDDETVAAAVAAVREANKAAMAKAVSVVPTAAKTRTDLIKLLLTKANTKTSDKNPPAARIAHFREAQRLAEVGRDYGMVVDIIEQAAKDFAVDEFDLKADGLARLADVVPTTTARAFADTCADQADRATDRGNYDAAVRFLGVALKPVNRAGLSKLQSGIEAHVAYLKRAKARYEPAKAALEALRVNADDPDANLAAGAFRFVFLGAWDDGVKLLAKGPPGEPKSAAAAELAFTSGASESAVGDLWAKAAAAARDPDDKAAYLARARWWLTKAADPKLVVKSPAGYDLRPGGLVAETWGVLDKGKTTRSKWILSPTLAYHATDGGFEGANAVKGRWAGYVLAPRPGRYKILLQSTDPVTLKSDGVVAAQIDAAAAKAAAKELVVREVSLYLTDKPVPVLIEWDGGNRAASQLRLSWVPPNGAEELVPPECLLRSRKDDEKVSK